MGAPQLPPTESLVTLLINDIATASQPFVLVLDDYEAIQAGSIHQAVEFLIEHQLPQVRLVLITHQDPPLPLPRLRVHRQVVEICEEDLRFTTDEAGVFLNRALGLDLDLPANGSLVAVLQIIVPADMQGRVFTLLQSASGAMIPLGLIIAGPLAEVLGAPIPLPAPEPVA